MRFSRRAYLREIVAETVVVHVTSGASVRGILTAVHSDVLVLAHAEYLNGDGSSIAVDGEALVPVSKVAFLQRLTGGDV